MQRGARADRRAGVQGNVADEPASFADAHSITHMAMRTDPCPRSDRSAGTDESERFDTGLGMHVGVRRDKRGRMNARVRPLRHAIEHRQQGEHRLVRLGDDDAAAAAPRRLSQLGRNEHRPRIARGEQGRVPGQREECQVARTRPVERGDARNPDVRVTDERTADSGGDVGDSEFSHFLRRHRGIRGEDRGVGRLRLPAYTSGL